MAVELRRPGLARATRDIDLVMRTGVVEDPCDASQIREALLESLLEDVDGDGFAFRLSGGSRLQDDSYGRPAWRYSVAGSLAGRVFEELRIDVVARPEEVTGTERRQLPDLLGFAGIAPRSFEVTDLRQQYAEKLHAMTRDYADGESSRVKDLVDLLLLLEDGVPADPALRQVVEHVFRVRGTHPIPTDVLLPSAEWGRPFQHLAEEIGMSTTSYREAHRLVAAHWRRVQVEQGE